MIDTVLSLHPGVSDAGRLPSLARPGQRITAAELTVLAMLGVSAAALSAVGKLNLGLPGHNILRVVFPMALGLALVPRRGSAALMGLFGMAGGFGFVLGGSSLGAGAATSLLLTGFLIELGLYGARGGASLYVRLVLACLVANLAAFAVKAVSKAIGVGGIEGGPLAVWWPKALPSYVACGALAGLLSAAAWFRFSKRAAKDNDAESKP